MVRSGGKSYGWIVAIQRKAVGLQCIPRVENGRLAAFVVSELLLSRSTVSKTQQRQDAWTLCKHILGESSEEATTPTTAEFQKVYDNLMVGMAVRHGVE